MDGNSLNVIEEKLTRLKEIIPEAFSENKIDWEKLKAAIGDDIEFKNERYVLNWAGKSDAFRALQSPSTATLTPCKEESVNFDKTQNIFIEGENLEVLKVLQKSYFNKIKMIYIDPPTTPATTNFISHGGNMKRVYRALIMFFLFPLVLFAADQSQQNLPQITPEALAVASSEEWLRLIDAGKYAEGWEVASEFFKKSIPQDTFVKSLQDSRKPLGEVKNRSVNSAQYTASLPGAPEGEYVMVQFKTDFANKADAVELVISIKAKDGQWKAGGYAIKKEYRNKETDR